MRPAVALAFVSAALLAACGSDDKKGAAAKAVATPPPKPVELPGGGRTIFPDKRVVGFYGHPAARQLGILGIGKPDLAGRRLLRQAKPYERKTRPVLPAMELLASIATFDGGDDGNYTRRTDGKTIRRYLRAARKINALLLLDIQPGKADFFKETVRLEKWLKEPDVGLALDPEWRVYGSEIPGKVIGSVSAREVNATTAWLDQLVTRLKLPQKLVVIHQFTDDMVRDKRKLQERKGLAIVLNADGFGGRAVKKSKYDLFTKGPTKFHDGFKLFYEEDVGLMTPKQVMRLKPPPDFVVYE